MKLQTETHRAPEQNARITKVLEHIVAEPWKHDQKSWMWREVRMPDDEVPKYNLSQKDGIEKALAEEPVFKVAEITVPEHMPRVWNFNRERYDILDHVGVTCGTAGCVAGWVCMLEGDLLPIGTNDSWPSERWGTESPEAADENYFALTVDNVVTPEGDFAKIADRAQELMGLDWETASLLFQQEWSTRQVVTMLQALDAGAERREELEEIMIALGHYRKDGWGDNEVVCDQRPAVGVDF